MQKDCNALLQLAISVQAHRSALKRSLASVELGSMVLSRCGVTLKFGRIENCSTTAPTGINAA
jgi:hypothetical protein